MSCSQSICRVSRGSRRSDIHIACGIDQGEILVVESYLEFWGNAVNRASKLGEDLAAPGEIPMTREVADALPPARDFNVKPVRVAISGIEIDSYTVEYSRNEPAVRV